MAETRSRTSLKWGADGSLYVLQFADNGILAGGTGSIQKLERNGSHSLIYGGLVAPTGQAIGGDGDFCVTSFSPVPGAGQVLQIAAIPELKTWTLLVVGLASFGGLRKQRAR